MSDLIRREDVEKTIRKLCDICGEDKKYSGIMCRSCNLDSFIDALESIPSAEPERKKGEWLPHSGDEDWDVCSVCGTGCKRREHGTTGDLSFPWVTEYNYQFCPNCGADMRDNR